MKCKVALFDFDNTVANGDSIVRLLKYDIRKCKNPICLNLSK